MDHIFNAGPVCLLLLAFIPIWIIVSIRFFLGRTRHLLSLFVFPVAFTMIALTAFVSSSYRTYLTLSRNVGIDPEEIPSGGLVLTRFCLICLAAAWLSLVTACLGFLKKNPPTSTHSD